MQTEMNPQIGDFLLTRNAEGPGQYGNPSPGHWNHAAICCGNDRIIEAQIEPYNRIIVSSWREFYYRYPEIVVLRPPAHFARELAQRSEQLVGMPYRKLALFFTRRSKVGHNCVSIFRQAWTDTTQIDPGWKIPDHMRAYPTLALVGMKR